MDIIERLKFDAARCEAQYSKGIATNIEEAIAEIERLKAQVQHEIKVGCEAEEEIERLRAALLKKSKCVALHMGGNHCIGKCLDPKDCSETPIPNEQ